MYQRIVLVGNLGGDPEKKVLPNGNVVSNFSLATNQWWTDSATGERVNRTTWWRVSVWGGQAEVVAKYLTKGRLVTVEGMMVPDDTGSPRIWTDSSGNPRASYELKASVVIFLPGKGAEGEEEAPKEMFDVPDF